MRAILNEKEVKCFNGNLGELQQFMFEASGGRIYGFNVTIETGYDDFSSNLRYISQYNQMYRFNDPHRNIYHIEYSVYRNINNIVPENIQYYPGYCIRSEHKLNLILGDILVWTGIEFAIFDKARIIIDNKKNIKNE